jgi:hypothetical protein
VGKPQTETIKALIAFTLKLVTLTCFDEPIFFPEDGLSLA